MSMKKKNNSLEKACHQLTTNLGANAHLDDLGERDAESVSRLQNIGREESTGGVELFDAQVGRDADGDVGHFVQLARARLQLLKLWPALHRLRIEQDQRVSMNKTFVVD